MIVGRDRVRTGVALVQPLVGLSDMHPAGGSRRLLRTEYRAGGGSVRDASDREGASSFCQPKRQDDPGRRGGEDEGVAEQLLRYLDQGASHGVASRPWSCQSLAAP